VRRQRQCGVSDPRPIRGRAELSAPEVGAVGNLVSLFLVINVNDLDVAILNMRYDRLDFFNENGDDINVGSTSPVWWHDPDSAKEEGAKAPRSRRGASAWEDQ